MELFWNGNNWSLQLDALIALGISMLLFLLGKKIAQWFPVIGRSYIPASVIGGLFFALINFIGYQTDFFTLSFDTGVQIPAMGGFFASVGLSLAFSKQAKLERNLVIYWLLCILMIFGQNLLGIALAALFRLPLFLGVLAGSASLVGGHGLAVSIGPVAERLGVTGASGIGIASATFGLIAGAFTGGPFARFLNLRSHVIEKKKELDCLQIEPALQYCPVETQDEVLHFTTNSFLLHTVLLSFILAVSAATVPILESFFPDLAIPSSVAAMIIGMLAGYIIKKSGKFQLNKSIIDLFSELFLAIFLTMASMSLPLWELTNLALPLLTILLCQVLFTCLFCYFITFPVMGRNYDALVICSGMIGHVLGATPNAMANMEAITSKHGPSDQANFIVPMAGGFLGDMVNVPLVMLLLNLLK
ncbi:MAG TPA: sodium/glutamate symporter [Bacillota bacterium]|nr:sodium/glutamate symporter [Bacillota bacterium]